MSDSAGSSSQSLAMQAATFKRLHPVAYLERFLSEYIREDGRAFEQAREVQCNVGAITTAAGSALVRLGQTTIVCGVKAEIAKPELARPKDGFLVPNVDLSPLCSPRFKPGPPSDEAQVLSDRLNTFLNASHLLPRSSLCIEPGAAVWTLYLDVVCINYDGGLLDATVLAAVAALRNTRLPKARYDADTSRTLCSPRIENQVPLALNGFPLTASFGIYDALHLLSDPSAFESALLDTHLSIGISTSTSSSSSSQDSTGGQLCYLWQAGRCRAVLPPGSASTSGAREKGKVLNDEDVLRLCVQRARERCQTLREVVLDAEKAGKR